MKLSTILAFLLACTFVAAQSRSAQSDPNGLHMDQLSAGQGQLRSAYPQQGTLATSERLQSGKATSSSQRVSRPQTAPEQFGPEEVLYSFQGAPDGLVPQGVILDSAGNLYGTTYVGGASTCWSSYGCGTVFELSPDGSGGWTEKVLYAFQGFSDGMFPMAGLTLDSAGNLYGTTENGGSDVAACTADNAIGCGTVFGLSPNGSGGWTEKVLYSFLGGGDGNGPRAGLTLDQAGNLYGTTVIGGTPDYGTVFELSPNGSGGWTEKLLYAFQGGTNDGEFPRAGLTLDQAGNLYGTTSAGGSPVLMGTVFELSPNGSGGWTEKLLYAFQDVDNGNDGSTPVGGVIFDQSGNLYGTTEYGGPLDLGTVFELTPNGSSGWTEKLLYSPPPGPSPSPEYPNSGLIFDQGGNLYGTTSGYATGAPGSVFELSPNGSGGWNETTLYVFPIINVQSEDPGVDPLGVILGQNGNLYGAAQRGGSPDGGVVYELLIEPFAALSPTSVSFGNQSLNIASSAQAVTLTNSGGPPLSVTSVQITGTNSSDFAQTNNCPSSLLAQASCTINVTFTPTAGGNRSATLSITDNAPPSPQTVPLTGVGLVPSAITLSPASLSFGNQSTSNQQTVFLMNPGQAAVVVTSVSIIGPNASEFAENNNCAGAVGAGNSCGINVTFTPNVLGSASASLMVSDDAPGSPQTLALTGTGVTGISVSPATITFPTQYVGTTGLPLNATLTNNTNADLTITNVAASPADFAALSACGSSVPAGNSCSIGVFFDPTASGSRAGTLTITDNALGSPQIVSLSGTGEDFSMASSGSATATVSPGQTANYTLSIAPGGGFKQTVALSCSGAPAGSNCTLSSSSVTLNGSSATSVTVSVTPQGSSAALRLPKWWPPASTKLASWLALLGTVSLLGLFALPRPQRRAAWAHVLATAFILCLGVTLIACGSSSSSSGHGGTPAGNYTLTVTGTFTSGSTNLTHNTKLTLVVN